MHKIRKITKELHYPSEENEYQYNLYAIFSLLGFIFFYFVNHKVVAPGQYENIYIRVAAATLAFLLLIRKYWPKFAQKYFRIFWYITLTFNLPFFFTFMLLQNNCSPEWQLNELMSLTVLAILTDLIVLLFLAPLGILLACSLYYCLVGSIVLPASIAGLVISYITILIFCSIYSYQKSKFYIKRLEHYEHITQLNHSLEQKINERTIELTTALAIKGEFLNNISHEIRTPIQGVASVSEGLIENWQKFDDQQKYNYISIVAQNAKRLFSLVANLLDLSKYNQRELVLDLRQVDLNEVINDVIDECKALYLLNKNVVFNFDSSKQVMVIIDKERISQVLRNLITNAIKFGQDDNIINIKISKDSDVKVTISDSGMGIPESEINSIFSPFTQSSRTKTKAGGTGLGLAICKSIIEAHNGRIWAENNHNRDGTTFFFTLPINQPHNITSQFNNKIKNIMIIDDEESALLTMELMLESSNYNIIKARGGIEGLAKIMENYHKIDLILLDLMMPDIHGIDLLKKIKENKLTKHIPVIIQSGLANEKEKQKCIKLGAVSFLNKPYSKKDLLERIQNIK